MEKLNLGFLLIGVCNSMLSSVFKDGSGDIVLLALQETMGKSLAQFLKFCVRYIGAYEVFKEAGMASYS